MFLFVFWHSLDYTNQLTNLAIVSQDKRRLLQGIEIRTRESNLLRLYSTIRLKKRSSSAVHPTSIHLNCFHHLFLFVGATPLDFFCKC